MSQSDTREFLIAALGASAGGLEPLEAFLKGVPANAGIAFVIVQHLAPDHATALPQLLGRHTDMPVEQARDKMQVAPNRVYVIPPNATLTIQAGALRVTPPVEARGARTPIDSFFSSLAEDRGENAVCIMLSGTGTDGTLGLRAIKEHGGMAMAQTLDSAKYDTILRSAIATGLVDHVLPVEEMPAKLMEHASYLVSLNGKPNHLREQIGLYMGKIHAVLRKRAGHDFSQYKESTIARRLERRMKASQIETVEQYVELLESQPEEADRLFNDLLIGVTHFFRDGEAFEALKAQVIPNLFDGKEAGVDVRVCIVGCATGEEAYSVAILLYEHASTLDGPSKIQIFATDIDTIALETARKGRYPESIAEHVSPERLERFFIKQDKAYQVKQELREMCLFSVHSFIKDPPFSRLDLISCRNVMIYLGQDLQRKIIPLFHYALRPGGYLFLGPSESAASHRELFETVDKKLRIFRRKETLPNPVITFPLADISRPAPIGGGKRPDAEERNLPKQLERIILERYRPACVTVKENGEAIYFSGRTSRYLEQPTGSPDANVINMAREGLRIPLRTALHRAVSARERVVQKQIPVQTNGTVSQVDLTVEPLAEFRSANLYMIVFEDAHPVQGSQPSTAPAADANSEEAIRHLEDELRSAQEHGQAMYEELESANEELKSANEEYQSTNEELETSKEELQSFNEELQTVNSEISRKAAELDRANNDLQNLLNSTQIATIFLDRESRIRNFTPAAGTVFRLIAGDVGRPITDLAAQFTDVDLVADIREVLRTLIPRERQLAGAGGRHYQMRVLPYSTTQNVIDGVVLTFQDVTQLEQAAQILTRAKAYAEDIVEKLHDPLLVLDSSARVKLANRAFYDLFQVSAEETLDAVFFDLGGGQWNIPELRRLLGELLPANRTMKNFEVEHDFPAIGRRTMLLNAHRIEKPDEKEPLILLSIQDTTERKRNAERLQRNVDFDEAVLSNMGEGLYTVDAAGVVISMNPAAEKLFGWSFEELRGRKMHDMTHHHHPDGTPFRGEDCVSLQVLRDGKGLITHEDVFIRKDGTFFDVIVSSSPLRAGGEIVGLVVVFRDVTERKRAEEQTRRLNADLQQFSYAASHDLQEPLRMVTSYTQLLAREYRGKLDPQADKFIAFAVNGAQRMEALLRDLREYWSADEQRVEHLVPVDCNGVLDKALAFLDVSIQEATAEITHDSLPTVVAEELPLMLLFQNLIGNAIKYRRPGTPPRVHLSAGRIAGAWKIAVKDNGIGIKTEHLDEIFTPFKRLHGRDLPGTGLGLAMCRKIVERYRGRIWLESTFGQGSTFYFTLPAQGGDV